MPSVRRRAPDEVVIALLWAMSGGALIGGAFFTLALTRLDGVAEAPWLIILGPLMVGAFSMFIVAPCTLAFGLPSVALINHLALGKWPALAVCIITAAATQVACIRLVFWDAYSAPDDFLFTAPFAMGAAIVLWWRLTRP